MAQLTSPLSAPLSGCRRAPPSPPYGEPGGVASRDARQGSYPEPVVAGTPCPSGLDARTTTVEAQPAADHVLGHLGDQTVVGEGEGP